MLKAYLPMVFTFLPMVRSVTPVQPLKAYSPMVSTVWAMLTEVRPVL